MSVAELIARWSSRATEWHRLGVAVDGAKVAAEIVDDLQQLERNGTEAGVTLREASRLGGYSVDRLQHLVAGGHIQNVGRKHRPRIRRLDVPVKPGYRFPDDGDVLDFSARRRIAASIITGDET